MGNDFTNSVYLLCKAENGKHLKAIVRSISERYAKSPLSSCENEFGYAMLILQDDILVGLVKFLAVAISDLFPIFVNISSYANNESNSSYVFTCLGAETFENVVLEITTKVDVLGTSVEIPGVIKLNDSFFRNPPASFVSVDIASIYEPEQYDSSLGEAELNLADTIAIEFIGEMSKQLQND
jgi:hypothetical protein